VVVNENNSQALVATVLATNGVTLTGLNLEYVSTAPTTIPASLGGTVTPPLAGAASISAVCQPPNCNMSSYNQIGLFGNGKPVTSNSVNITAPGTNSTVSLPINGDKGFYRVKQLRTDIAVGQLPDGQQSIPSKQILRAAGQQVQFSGRPVDLVLSPDGSTVYIKNMSGLLVVESQAGERRFPMVSAFVSEVDLAGGRIVLTPWEEEEA